MNSLTHEELQKKKTIQARDEGVQALTYIQEQVELSIMHILNSADQNITTDQMDYNVYTTIINAYSNLKRILEIQQPIFKERLDKTYWITNWKRKPEPEFAFRLNSERPDLIMEFNAEGGHFYMNETADHVMALSPIKRTSMTLSCTDFLSRKFELKGIVHVFISDYKDETKWT